MSQQPLAGKGHLSSEALRSPSDTPHLVKLLWTSDQPNAENCTWRYTTHKHNIQTSLPPAGFEPTVAASERWQTHASDRAATEIDIILVTLHCILLLPVM